MKIKITLASLMVVSFLACTNEKKPALSSDVQTETADEHSTTSADHDSGLSLNNGNKWSTDESTRFHATNLNALVDDFQKKGSTDIESYHLFAGTMQEELGDLVKDCKMKGADHDALHLWLEPVMQGVNDLKKAGTLDEGKPIADMLAVNVLKFNQYFENAH